MKLNRYWAIPTNGGDWTSKGDGTHIRICSTNSNHVENGNCTGGTATCKDKRICTVCQTTYGSTNSNNHTGGIEIQGKVDATATTPGYTGDTWCLGCNTKIRTGSAIPATGGSGGGYTPPSSDNDDDGGNTQITPDTPPTVEITVPISGDDNRIDVGASVIGEKVDGIVVFYVDDNGNRKACETNYDSVKKRVNWKTDHLSVYMIGYDGPQLNPDTGDNTPAQTVRTYTVQKGDTLWATARKYGCTVAEIVSLNSELITDPDLIFAGWKLKIP